MSETEYDRRRRTKAPRLDRRLRPETPRSTPVAEVVLSAADFVRAAIVDADQAEPSYAIACRVAKGKLSGAQRSVLRQLVERGPVADGDVASKAARDDLIGMGLASRACVAGEQGFAVANYRGWDVWRAE